MESSRDKKFSINQVVTYKKFEDCRKSNGELGYAYSDLDKDGRVTRVVSFGMFKEEYNCYLITLADGYRMLESEFVEYDKIVPKSENNIKPGDYLRCIDIESDNHDWESIGKLHNKSIADNLKLYNFYKVNTFQGSSNSVTFVDKVYQYPLSMFKKVNVSENFKPGASLIVVRKPVLRDWETILEYNESKGNNIALVCNVDINIEDMIGEKVVCHSVTNDPFRYLTFINPFSFIGVSLPYPAYCFKVLEKTSSISKSKYLTEIERLELEQPGSPISNEVITTTLNSKNKKVIGKFFEPVHEVTNRLNHSKIIK